MRYGQRTNHLFHLCINARNHKYARNFRVHKHECGSGRVSNALETRICMWQISKVAETLVYYTFRYGRIPITSGSLNTGMPISRYSSIFYFGFWWIECVVKWKSTNIGISTYRSIQASPTSWDVHCAHTGECKLSIFIWQLAECFISIPITVSAVCALCMDAWFELIIFFSLSVDIYCQ